MLFEVIFLLFILFIVFGFVGLLPDLIVLIIQRFIENPLLTILKSIPLLLILVYIVACIMDKGPSNKANEKDKNKK